MRGAVRMVVSVLALAAGTERAVAAEPATERVSVATSGAQANGSLYDDFPALSANGRFVAFNSQATNLVARDTNGKSDVFVRDRRLGTTTRVSVGAGNRQANDDSLSPSVTADGRLVAFESLATNLTPGAADTNDESDVFVRDRKLGTTVRVSVGEGGGQPDGGSFDPVVAPRARAVAFTSIAGNLVPGGTDRRAHVFVRDLEAARTVQVDLGLGGDQPDADSGGPSVSADGRLVAFYSQATNLVSGGPGVGDQHVYLRDLRAGTTVQVDVGPGGSRPNGDSLAPDLSAGGRYVVFESLATNLIRGGNRPGLFVRDLEAGTTTRIGGRTEGYSGRISAGGRHVVFSSLEAGLVPGDTNIAADVFLHDVRTGTTTRVSVGPGGQQANWYSIFPVISDDGGTVAFVSGARNLVPGDTNNLPDVFVRTR